MPNRCVVYGCSNTPNPAEGIFLFTIPFYGDERPEAVRRRRSWVKFVDLKRKNFVATKNSSICCKHFKPGDFTIRFTNLPGHEKPMIPRLQRDEIGICVYPSIQTSHESDPTCSDRKRRKIIKTALAEFVPQQPQVVIDETATTSTVIDDHVDETVQESIPATTPIAEEEPQEASTSITSTGAQHSKKKFKAPCTSCSRLRRQKNSWQQRWKSQINKVKKMKEDLDSANHKVLELENEIKVRLLGEEKLSGNDKNNISSDYGEVEEDIRIEYESSCTGDDNDDSYVTETETETEDDEPLTEDEVAGQSESLKMHGTNLRTEPKHIVFLSQLLLLFNFCHSCKADDPLVEARQVGTEVFVTTSCKNPKCQNKENTWHSQPSMKYSSGHKGPAGNFLLSMAILFAGGSATKVLQVLSHMGLGHISLRTFFRHQTTHLFPIIHLHWKQYQSKLVQQIKALTDGLVVAGDGRHDSMGHNAKYGAYTILCCTIPQIIHFSLVQRNQAESSNAMEFMGFKNCMEFLLETCGLDITTFISDRHATISSHMKKDLTQIKHFYDLWHLKKKIRKVLTKLAKEKYCEVIKDWIKPCENHLYWSAMSTYSGEGNLIWAKFESFLSHVINKHTNLANPLFNSCAHREIRARTWLEKDSTAHDKLVAALTKTSLVKGIKQASPLEQTSSLEGFHSVINYFAPKMTAYSYVGMYCRHILATLHFNLNLDRETKKRPDGTEQLRVSYPKFKNGEATVRNICVAQKFDYVEELFQTFLETTKEQVEAAKFELKEMTPLPMNSVLDKQPVEEAVQKRAERRNMTVHNIPATAEAAEVQEPATEPGKKAAPKCRLCKQPMKGHSKVKDCPRNKKT